VGHSCNASYSGGRDQENHSLKSAGAGKVPQGVGPEFKLQYPVPEKTKQNKTKKRKEKKSRFYDHQSN
jgi:hypothetical protein